MKKTILQGILHILPLVLSLWIFWSIIVTLDDFGLSILQLVGINLAWKGIGFILIFAVLLIAGLAFSVSPVRWLYQKIETQVLRFPLFKTVYGAIKDLASLVSTGDKAATQRQTVLLKQSNGSFVVGFVTSDKLPKPLQEALPSNENDQWVPVLLQLSYQVAGVTSIVKRSDLIYVDWSFEEAMRFMLTAGISQTGKSEQKD